MEELPKITSRENARLIRARRVRDGHIADIMFIEGKRLANEALDTGLTITECFVSEKFAYSAENREAMERVTTGSFSTSVLPDKLFQTISDTNNSQGLILLSERPRGSAGLIERALNKREGLPIVIFLTEVNNPSNLGAVIRSSEAAGACGVIISSRSADPFSPRSLRSSMGSAFRAPIWNDVSFDSAIEWATRNELTPTAAAADAEISHVELDWTRPRLLVFGSEAHGLSSDQFESVQDTVSIRMSPDVESLNLAVSAGILLFEARRQNT